MLPHEVSVACVGRVQMDESFLARLVLDYTSPLLVRSRSSTFQISTSSKHLARLLLSWGQGLARRPNMTKPIHNFSERLMGVAKNKCRLGRTVIKPKDAITGWLG